MKQLLFLLLTAAFVLVSCQTSEGLKFGTLQKVSHKTFPCNYYEIQVAFEGGESTGGKNPSFQNTQDIKIDQAAFDTLQNYLGEKVIFDYADDGIAMCGSSKKLTSIRIKGSSVAVQQVKADSLKSDSASKQAWEQSLREIR